MKSLTAKTRITIGLTCLIVTLLVTISSLGFGPSEQRVQLERRDSLVSAVAIACSTHINRRQLPEIEVLLKGIVARNSDVLSAGVRRNNQRIAVATDDHESLWNGNPKGEQSSTHIRIPLKTGETNWGSVELLFEPIQEKGVMGMLSSPWVGFFVMIGCIGFFVIYYYLGMVLKQLDPSKAVPKRVRDALNTLAEGLILTDQKGRALLANDAFSEWAGQHPDELIAKDASEFGWIHDDATRDQNGEEEGEDPVLPWVKALETGEAQAGQFLKLRTSKGKLLTLVANSSPIVVATGKCAGVLTSFDDVSELEEHKVELSKARIEADRANKEKSKFLARMSHEIRTPMNAILGYTEVLQFGMEEDEDKRQQHLSTIQGSGEHLLALINDILDLSKIESGQMELELSRISLHDLILQVVSVLGIKATEKGIRLDYEAKGKIPQTILTDGVRLKQTIINLVGNAIKFTEEGGVLIRPEMTEKDGLATLAIHIADTGIGMTPQAMAKIFDPFAQADTSITRRFGGTGLGLSISRELAEQLGGSVTVRSKPGCGSIFTIMIDPGDLDGIPMLSNDELGQGASQESSNQSALQLPAANILIVDDGEANRELVALFLKRANVQFDIAVNGKMAVEMVNQGNFDVVLMDMHMPIMDGFEATQTLRAQGNTIPIIALTADAMAQDERKCRAAGCSGFVSKPIKRATLFHAIREALPGLPMQEPQSVNPARLPTPSETVFIKELSVESPLAQAMAAAEALDRSNENLKSTAKPQNENSNLVSEEDFIVSELPMDDQDFIDIATMFTSHLNMKIGKMYDALGQGDFEQLFEIGHWLKGSGGSAGFDAFSVPGKELETLAKSNNLDAVRAQVDKIKSMADRIRIIPDPQLVN